MPSVVRAASSRVGQQADEGAVVERARQRIAPGRLDQLDRLSRQPSLRGPEDQEQQDRGEERGTQRDDEHVPANLVQSGEDRDPVAPEAHDADDVARHVRDRQPLAEDPRAVEVCRWHAGFRTRHDRRFGSSGERWDRGRRIRRGRHGSEERPVCSAQLGMADATVAAGDRGQVLLEGRAPGRLDRGADRQIGGGQSTELRLCVREAANGGEVAVDDGLHRDRGEVRRDQRCLGGGRDPDQRDERAEDEQQEDGAANPRLSSEHGQRKAPNGRRPDEPTGWPVSVPPDIRTGGASPRRLRCALAPGLRSRARARWRPYRTASTTTVPAIRSCQPRLRLSMKIQMYPR